MRVYAYTERGTRHEANEDALLIGRRVLTAGSVHLVGEFAYLAVADGVGGLPHGEVASSFVLSALSACDRVDEDILCDINDALLREAAEKYGGDRMATTLTGVFLGTDTPILFHIGNTRAYCLKRGQFLSQITKDDTVVYRMYQRGLLTREEMPYAEHKNKICACFGGADASYFDLTVTPLTIELPLILTSDGIHDYVDADTLEALLIALPDRKEAVRRIVALARERGSTDDLSIVICEKQEATEASPSV